MAISAKTLRSCAKTGCGMMDCKKALTEADGDIDKAIEILREKGLAAASKKAGRIAAEGMVYADSAFDNGRLLSSRSTPRPTSSPRTTSSLTSSRTLAKVVAEENPADVEALMACKTGRRHR